MECLCNRFLEMVTDGHFDIDRVMNVGTSLNDLFHQEGENGLAQLIQCHRSYLLISFATKEFAHIMNCSAKYNHRFEGNEKLLIEIDWQFANSTETFTFALTKYHLQKWLPSYILEEKMVSEEEIDPQLQLF